LRVALVDPGGFTPPYDVALARGLAAQGCEVTLFGDIHSTDAGVASDIRRHFYRASTWPIGRSLPRPMERLAKGLSHGPDLLRLGRLLDALRIDILHVQWAPLPVVDRLALAWLRRRVPLVFTLHDSNPYNGAGGALMRAGYGGLLRQADAVIVHTGKAARRAGQWTDPARVHQVPHGLLSADISPPAAPPAVPGRRLVLLQLGKIKPYKGVDTLLEALALLPPAVRDRLEVRIVGKPYLDTTPLERFVSERRLGGCVRFRFDFVTDEEMHALLAEADAMLLPYREIDASGVALTAIALGLPVLGTAIDGFSELFGERSGARLVPPENPQALASALREWARAPDAVAALRKAMLARRASVPGWADIGLRTVAVYGAARAHWMRSRRPARRYAMIEESRP
jgi:glycosyltransferase involved in cell wall biosynthesis